MPFHYAKTVRIANEAEMSHIYERFTVSEDF